LLASPTPPPPRRRPLHLGAPEAGRLAYAAGHLPGAVYLDLERDLSAPVGRHGGRHPLPERRAPRRRLAPSGSDDDAWVVAYDAGDGMVAGRLWWLLRWMGHERVQVLDGGLGGVERGGRATTVDDAVPTPTPEPSCRGRGRDGGRPRLGPRPARRPLGVTVVDARAPERYRGEVEPLDPRAGHLPGAINLPYAGNLEGGRFRSLDALAERYRSLAAADTVVVYCGSGVSAAHDLMALEAVGVKGRSSTPAPGPTG
jgi:thiosulfate/3-mercaptopyruvate sulfurtransferase